MEDFYNILNATVHNLKGVSAKIPKYALTCLVGKSGSGKSSFAIDVLLRACVEAPIASEKEENVVLGATPAIAVRQRLDVDRHKCSIAKYLGITEFLASETKDGTQCLRCSGNGTIDQPLPDRIIVNPELPVVKAIHPLLRSALSSTQKNLPRPLINSPFSGLTKSVQSDFFHGSDENTRWQGIQKELLFFLKTGTADLSEKDLHNAFFKQVTCDECAGLGVCFPKNEVKAALSRYTDTLTFGECINAYITSGLVPIGAPVSHLSMGQMQWVRILFALQGAHPGMLILFDEPAAGMCKEDAIKLVSLFRLLVKRKCTVVVIEHSPYIIPSSDFVIEFGPGGGSEGGEIVYSGTTSKFLRERKEFLDTKNWKSQRIKAKTPQSFFTCNGSAEYGLEKVELQIPDSMWTCIAGNIASGKSGAIDIINRAVDKSPGAWMGRIGLDKISGREKFRRPNIVDQKPIGLNPHSIPLTYIDGMTRLRELYSRIANQGNISFGPEFFSFNTKNGQCHECKGFGCVEKMINGEPYWIKCKTCNGLRYNAKSLKIKYKNKSIGQMLNLTVSETKKLLLDEKLIVKKLEFLEKAGLGYLAVGQPSNTLSGGEAQRVKIAKHLSKKLGDRTLYLLDTPSRGLSCLDVGFLVKVFNSLKQKNTVLIADNHPAFVYGCDWLIILEKINGVTKQIYSGRPDCAPNMILNKITDII